MRTTTVPRQTAGRVRQIMLASFALAILGAAPSAVLADTSSLPAPTVDRLLARARAEFDASQVIVVVAGDADRSAAVLSAYEYADGRWREAIAPVPAVLGQTGITLHKREGDLKSPAGFYRIGRAFGSADKPAGTRLPYTVTTPYDFWVDDPGSGDYNHWETWFADPKARWKSFERLLVPDYKYAMVIRYNMDPVRKGAGSAIFLHVWEGEGSSTVGCTAISESNILKLLRWVDPAREPVLVQGTPAQLQQALQSAEQRRGGEGAG